MKRNLFNQCISEHRFRDLFIELEWDNSRGEIYIDIDDVEYTFQKVAEKRGFQVLTCEVATIPPTALCKRIDTKLRPSAQDYILIYHVRDGEHQKWVIPVRNTDKRDLVTVEYQTAAQADFIYNKLEGLNMDGICNIADVKSSIQLVFTVNSEKITKDFFREFKTEHKAFLSMISGLDDHIEDKKNRNKDWYTSVMLNRLMFCYFIQKKGFLDGNVNYLHEKLLWMQGLGRDQFFGSFYKGFLCSLFHDGLNSPRHQEDFRQKYGRIPYLNGGMFDEHQLEQEYRDIDIKDEAFERLFTFFDKWEWHLDTRLTASGKDINPDVLGYIFEQYINDRAAMGAYYTKEDITEYIGKNCILPFIMDRVKAANAKDFEADGYVWQTLRNSGDRYIYDAVKKGYTSDWQQRIPDYIYKGIDTTTTNLLERRSRWNEKTSAEFALPTEIWRETVERLQRCDKLIKWISSAGLSPSGESEGGCPSINDFITYNLDIRQFVYDLLLNTQDHTFVEHFYAALQSVTILDPTCGSGAFLFAAMNILEPLYEVCIDRMEDWHRQNPNLFKPQLDEINKKYRSNRQYFIYKSIILRNLYGVDIMVEATEIAKLRLFLKMVAVVEVDMRADNLGLDPLPDIDFNIRCGNTLVGYATQDELERDLGFAKDILEELANQEFRKEIELEMDKAARAFEQFKTVQFCQEEDMLAFKEAKKQLRSRLAELNDALNNRMYSSITAGVQSYGEWRESHQPFHWLAEFYEIIHGKGGFDVIIGNPPYVTFTDSSLPYKVNVFKTYKCKNLFALCGERCVSLSNSASSVGYIIPLSGLSIDSFEPLQKLIFNKTISWNSFYSGDRHPAELFNGVGIRAAIHISRPGMGKYVTGYMRFYTNERPVIFEKLNYTSSFDSISAPKLDCETCKNIITKINNEVKALSSEFISESSIYYHAAPIHWSKALYDLSFLKANNLNIADSYKEKGVSKLYKEYIFNVINSTLFFMYWTAMSDCYNLTQKYFNIFKIPELTEEYHRKHIQLANDLSADLMNNMEIAEYTYKKRGNVRFGQFFPKKSKVCIDKIDSVLAESYPLTEEELDFIINYDIKYRMGDSLTD